MPPKPQRPAKGVTLSGITVKGIKYVIEFISEKEGRAYFLTSDEKKGAYAGKFTLSPVQVLTNVPESSVRANNERPASPKAAPKAPTPAPAKETPKPVSVPKKESPKPAAAAPKKNETKAPAPAAPPKKEETKPAPAATPKKNNTKAAPAAAATTPAVVGFFEKQEGLGCGRHALNNLLGERMFIKGKQSDGFKFPPPAAPYSIQGICSMVSERLALHGIIERCEADENYDVNTLVGALDYLGYSSEEISPTFAIPESKDYLGLLINLGVVQNKPKHWVALKFKSRAPNGLVTYTLYDSLYARPMETTLANYLKTRPSVYTIKVMLPKGAPRHPYERIDELPYPEGSAAAVSAAHAAAKKAGWEEKISATKKAKYWYNPATGETTWQNPFLEVVSGLPPRAAATATATATETATAVKAAVTPVAAKPPSAKAVAKAPYFEKGVFSGMHSINNVLGEQAVVMGYDSDVLPSPVKKPLSMLAVCKAILPEMQKTSMMEYRRQICSVTHVNKLPMIVGAFNALGYMTGEYPAERDATFSEMSPATIKEAIGVVIDLGENKEGFPYHWIALKKEGDAYTYLDPEADAPVLNVNLNDYLKKTTKKTTIFVFPTPRTNMTVLEQFKEPQPTIEEMKLCHMFYDPCTKEPLGTDPQVLSDRIQEIWNMLQGATAGGTRRTRRKGKGKTRKGGRT